LIEQTQRLSNTKSKILCSKEMYRHQVISELEYL